MSQPSHSASAESPRRTLLVVDDELHVREVVRRMLAMQGYTVLTAGSVAEALELLARCRGEVDLVLSDITMPEQDGWELFRAVREQWPRTDVLFMSGHHHSPHDPAAAAAAGPAVLAKPFTMESLTSAVRLALEA